MCIGVLVRIDSISGIGYLCGRGGISGVLDIYAWKAKVGLDILPIL